MSSTCYLSLDWPTAPAWVNYNSLQQLSYFTTVFLAAPLALLTGLGMSPALSTRFRRISKLVSIQAARSLHFLVLVWFLVFLVVHVALVFTTDLQSNLNQMYAARGGDGWTGLWVFLASMAVVIGGWIAATPFTLRRLRALPHHEQITQHFCIQGWSGVTKWGGVSMRTILDLVKPRPEAKWVVFYSLGDGPDKWRYYDAHPIEQMSHRLTMLAYDMNGRPLSFGHGAPLRLRNEVQLGFKQVKWIEGIEFVADFSRIGGGHGGYNQDHEFFGYHQAL
ncbi:molybdopterin-binding protein [Streptomyces sp. NBRC 110611]|uniref:molybdopterin-dependent oxidoreductase n=1 Tax=Streptomyces sp. NBRC 110611 TaxID=1621259 RepID=UPI00082FFA1F|nr:molybdopterin-dependent oxidoreductase [Streptomyces sp. NBRC 110611]GAU70529.1 molybdopterin-binding protein [Streptomyces sp. NBRC 110611]